jgi:RNA polymerase sigma-70 factor (ECF subfamily)
MASQERQSLLERAIQGDTPALGRLLDGFRPYVRVIVHAVRGGRVSTRLDDSDLIQDVFLEASRCFADFRGGTVGEFVVWLRQIAIRAANRTLRRLERTGKRDPAREEDIGDLAQVIPADESTPSGQAIRHEQAAQMAEGLARLPEEMQRVLLWRLVDGMAHGDIAQRLERSPAAVRMLYLRALRRLRELMME